MKQGLHMSKEWASSHIALTVEKSSHERSRANLKTMGNKKLHAQVVASSYCGGANVKECCRRLNGSSSFQHLKQVQKTNIKVLAIFRWNCELQMSPMKIGSSRTMNR